MHTVGPSWLRAPFAERRLPPLPALCSSGKRQLDGARQALEELRTQEAAMVERCQELKEAAAEVVAALAEVAMAQECIAQFAVVQAKRISEFATVAKEKQLRPALAVCRQQLVSLALSARVALRADGKLPLSRSRTNKTDEVFRKRTTNRLRKACLLPSVQRVNSHAFRIFGFLAAVMAR